MAKTKRTSKKKQQKRATTTIIIMLVVIFLIIGYFVVKTITDSPDDTKNETTTTEPASDNYYIPDNSYENENPTVNNSRDEAESDTETELTEIEADATEKEPQSETKPVNVDNESIEDKIISHYTDYMGFPDGVLFVNESEITKKGDIYTYTLRLNSGSTPNKLIGDVKVNIGTGEVTDSMGTEEWNVNN